MSLYEPFLLRPAGKDYLWGGMRLKTEYGKALPLSPLAETWECSVHPDGPSMVDSGIHRGRPLPEVLKEHPEYLGTHARGGRTLPILVKLIDAKEDL
ncbi:MAG: type I phosphomannose isomerase catalytic subunit, partial [Anaerotignum sp.]